MYTYISRSLFIHRSLFTRKYLFICPSLFDCLLHGSLLTYMCDLFWHLF